MPVNGESLPPIYADDGYITLIEDLGDPHALTLIKDNNGTVVRQAEFNGELFIVRSPHYLDVDYIDPSENETIQFPYEAFEKRILALRDALGVIGLEQMVCYSLPEEIVVTQHAGTPVDELPSSAAQQIEPGEWEKLIESVEAACARDLLFDFGSASNLLYAPGTGFTLIDFGRAKDDGGIYRASPASEFEQLILLISDEIAGSDEKSSTWRALAQSAIAALDSHYPNGSDVAFHKNNIDRLRTSLSVA